MRGEDKLQADMFSYLSPESRVRKDHPTPDDSDDGGSGIKGDALLFRLLYATKVTVAPEKGTIMAVEKGPVVWLRSGQLRAERGRCDRNGSQKGMVFGNLRL